MIQAIDLTRFEINHDLREMFLDSLLEQTTDHSSLYWSISGPIDEQLRWQIQSTLQKNHKKYLTHN